MQETIRRNKMIRFIQLTLIGKEFNPVDLYVTPSPEILELFSKVATRNIEAITVSFARKNKTPFMIANQFAIKYKRARNWCYTKFNH